MFPDTLNLTTPLFADPSAHKVYGVGLFLCLPLRLVPSSSWVKIFFGILSSCILSRWPNEFILCPFIHFTMFSPLLISSSSRFVLLFHSPFSYLGQYILLNIFLSKISTPCSSFFVIVHVSASYATIGLIIYYSLLYSANSIYIYIYIYIYIGYLLSSVKCSYIVDSGIAQSV